MKTLAFIAGLIVGTLSVGTISAGFHVSPDRRVHQKLDFIIRTLERKWGVRYIDE